ncbi:MAG: hypothetical protein QW587_10025 [Candidatus Bathyarchaeia archaeon]
MRFNSRGFLAFVGLSVIAALLIHHRLIAGRWFELVQLLHHEGAAVAAAFLLIGLWAASTLKEKEKGV